LKYTLIITVVEELEEREENAAKEGGERELSYRKTHLKKRSLEDIIYIAQNFFCSKNLVL